MNKVIVMKNNNTFRRWKPYPEYKDSGVEWLGEIPEHWELKRAKDVAGFNLETLTGNEDPNWVINYVDIGNVDSNGCIIDVQEMAFDNAPSRARRKVRNGNTILSTVRTYLKAIAFIENPSESLIVSTGFSVLSSKDHFEPKYLWRLVQSQQFVDAVVSNSEGVSYPAINPSRLSCLAVWSPPFDEQRTIAAFLDRETAKIDALIAKKERMVELLKEKRIALISHAVTKGLDPDAPMKDSGVEWLGEIPAHWELKRAKDVAELNRETLTGNEDPYWVIHYVDIGNVDSNGCIIDIQEMAYDNAPSRARRKVRNGDTILSTVRTYLKAIAFIENPSEALIVSTGFSVLSPKDYLEPKYLWRLVQSQQFVDAVVSNSEGVSYPAINPSRLSCLAVWSPPFDEQRAIAAFLDRETAKIDALITKFKEAIEQLKEYRIALISAAVTGKIDVREEVPL